MHRLSALDDTSSISPPCIQEGPLRMGRTDALFFLNDDDEETQEIINQLLQSVLGKEGERPLTEDDYNLNIETAANVHNREGFLLLTQSVCAYSSSNS